MFLTEDVMTLPDNMMPIHQMILYAWSYFICLVILLVILICFDTLGCDAPTEGCDALPKDVMPLLKGVMPLLNVTIRGGSWGVRGVMTPKALYV